MTDIERELEIWLDGRKAGRREEREGERKEGKNEWTNCGIFVQ